MNITPANRLAIICATIALILVGFFYTAVGNYNDLVHENTLQNDRKTDMEIGEITAEWNRAEIVTVTEDFGPSMNRSGVNWHMVLLTQSDGTQLKRWVPSTETRSYYSGQHFYMWDCLVDNGITCSAPEARLTPMRSIEQPWDDAALKVLEDRQGENRLWTSLRALRETGDNSLPLLYQWIIAFMLVTILISFFQQNRPEAQQ